MEAGQGSAMARLTRPLPSLPTMSKERMGRSYSKRGYSTQCSTCQESISAQPFLIEEVGVGVSIATSQLAPPPLHEVSSISTEER
jgi:hypothetical protein